MMEEPKPAANEQFDAFGLYWKEEAESFDPFGLKSEQSEVPPPESETQQPQPSDDDTATSPYPPPQVNRVKQAVDDLSLKTPTGALPPRLMIRFHVHEDVSSVAKTGAENEGASEVRVDGTLQARAESSDANKNAPFLLMCNTLLQFRSNEEYVGNSDDKPIPSQAVELIEIPKYQKEKVVIGTFPLVEQVRHMPLLVERKVTMYNSTVRMAVQVRSKLSNQGDMINFTIAVAVPERVNSSTLEVLRGEGKYNDLKRTIQWTMPVLPRGESFMVSAQAELWSPVTREDQTTLQFPVLLRCFSYHDQISSVEFGALEAESFPATVSYNQTHSFRLLHRLM